MSNDIDFEQFIKLLDGALASDDKNVKQALRKFLFVAAMVMGNDTEPGPFTQMMDTIDALQRRIAALENQNTFTTTDNIWTTQEIGTGIGTGSGTGIGWAGGTTGAITGGSATSTVFTTNATSNISTITLPSTSTSGTTYTVTNNPSNTTTSTLRYNMEDPKTGTSIKEEIKEGLEKLAKLA